MLIAEIGILFLLLGKSVISVLRSINWRWFLRICPVTGPDFNQHASQITILPSYYFRNEVCRAQGHADCWFIHVCIYSFRKYFFITHHVTTCAKLLGVLRWPGLGGRAGGLFSSRSHVHKRPQIKTPDLVPKWSFILAVSKGNLWNISILDYLRVLIILLWQVLIP